MHYEATSSQATKDEVLIDAEPLHVPAPSAALATAAGVQPGEVEFGSSRLLLRAIQSRVSKPTQQPRRARPGQTDNYGLPSNDESAGGDMRAHQRYLSMYASQSSSASTAAAHAITNLCGYG